MSRPAISVHPIHFEDFSGHQFERLVFAYQLRADEWRTLDWYGQSGGDSGRDIWGVRPDGRTVCIQCANRKSVTAAKVLSDLDKVINAPSGVPYCFIAIFASSVSAAVRDKIRAHALAAGISQCEIWSGQEFEERLRQVGESLLKRFVGGVAFPDAPSGLRQIAEFKVADDIAVIGNFSQVFDRPAFRTPFAQESSLPAFRQAIGDTIQALNTGIWQTRDGKQIARLPSRHQLASSKLRDELDLAVRELVELRSRFERLVREGAIRPCECGKDDCPVFFFSDAAASEMDALRSALMMRVSKLDGHETSSAQSATHSVTVVGSNNTGIIANHVTIRGGGRAKPILVPGSIGTDPEKYNYIEYLVKRLTEFRKIGASYGQGRHNQVNPGATRRILESQLGGLTKDLPLHRFKEVVLHLKTKIDDMAQGRTNRKRNARNYHSFEEHGHR